MSGKSSINQALLVPAIHEAFENASQELLGPGEFLFRVGDKPKALYYLLEGEIRLVRVDALGKEVVLRTIRGDSLVAEASLFSSAYHCDAVVVQPAELLRVDLHQARQALEHAEPMVRFLCARLAHEVVALRARIELMNIHSAEERVLTFLRRSGEPGSPVVELDRPLKVIASELGLAHETLYRTLARLESSKQLVRQGKRCFRLLGRTLE